MSDLFDEFVFDLQRFTETTYGAILDYPTGEGEKTQAGKYYWPKEDRSLYMFDTAKGVKTNVNKATVTFTGIADTDADGKGTIVTTVTNIKPASGSDQTFLFYAEDDLNDKGVPNLADNKAASFELKFSSADGKFNFDVGDAATPQTINFVSAGDKLILNDPEDAATKGALDIATASYTVAGTPLGDVAATPEIAGIDISSGASFDAAVRFGRDRYLELTNAATGAQTFEIGNLVATDSFTFKENADSNVTVAFGPQDGNFEAGRVVDAEKNAEYLANGGAPQVGKVSFTLKGNLDITTEKGAVVAVVDGNGDLGISDYYGNKNKAITIDGTKVELQSAGFVYDNNNTNTKSPVLFIYGVEDVNGEKFIAQGSTAELTIRTFKIGDNPEYKVKGLSQNDSGFVLDSSGKVTGFIFDELEKDATLLFEKEVPSGFKIYDGNFDTTGFTVPTVTDNVGDTTIGIKKTQVAVTGANNTFTNQFVLVVGNGAIVSDADTTLNITCGDNEYVEIAFDTKTGQILGVGATNVIPDATVAATDQNAHADLSEYATLSINVDDVASDGTKGLYFVEKFSDKINPNGTFYTVDANDVATVAAPEIAANQSLTSDEFVAIGSGKYTYGKDTIATAQQTDDGITITLSSSNDTLFYVDDADKIALAKGQGTITDATDDQVDNEPRNNPVYEYNSTNGNAYLVTDQTAINSTININTGGEVPLDAPVNVNAPTTFVFADEGDVLKDSYVASLNNPESGMTYGYVADTVTGAYVEIDQPVAIGPAGSENGSFAYSTTLVSAGYKNADSIATFAVGDFGEAQTTVTAGEADFVFGAQSSQLIYTAKPNAQEVTPVAFNATSDTVGMNVAAAALLEGDAYGEPQFSINGAGVDIKGGPAGADGYVIFTAKDKNAGGVSSLFGFADQLLVNNAGNIGAIYTASVGTALDGNLTVGETTYNYAATGASQASRAYFTVDGTVATGFGFATVGDAITVTEEMTVAKFALTDAASGSSIKAPTVLEEAGGDAKQRYVITKDENPYYRMSDFQAGNFVGFENGASITFETLGAAPGQNGSTAAIKFDMTTPQKLHSIVSLVGGDQVEVAGAKDAVIFDKDTIKVSGDNVSYVYSKTSSVSAELKEVSGNVTIEQLGSVSNVYTAAGQSGVGMYTFNVNGVAGGEFFVGQSSVANGVQFVVGSDSKVAEIKDINATEFVMGYFTDPTKLNGKDFAISGDEGGMAVIGNEKADGLTGVFGLGGASVVVSNAAGASVFVVDQDSNITFGASSKFAVAGESGAFVGFLTDANLAVKGISFLGANESVTGDFSNVEDINGGNKFDITGDPDKSLTVVGNKDENGISMIAGAGSGVVVNSVGGASLVQTDEEGTFTFGSNPFQVLGDKSVQFVMNGDSAVGVKEFGVEGQSAALVGKLNGFRINDNISDIEVEGDKDNILAYLITKEGYKALAAVGGDDVTIKGTGGASFVILEQNGKYTFDDSATAPEYVKTYTFAGGDSFVVVGRNGSEVVIDDIAKGESITGDFSGAATTFIAEDGASAVVQIDGDTSVMVENDDILIRNLSDSAVIVKADNVEDAWTDAVLLGTKIGVTDADGHNFTVEGGIDEDGVNFKLDGAGHIIGVSSLGEGVVLRGSLSALENVNGEDFKVVETAHAAIGGDGEFAIVGASDGIGAIAELGGVVTVINAGGAEKLTSDDNIVLNNAAGEQAFAAFGAKDMSQDDLTGIDIASASTPQAMIAQLTPYIDKSDGVDFVLDGDKVTAIDGVGSNEIVAGTFDEVTEINGEEFDVQGASAILVQGGDSGINAIVAAYGDDVQVNKTAGAEHVLAAGVDKITFGESAAFEMAAEDGVTAVGFGLSGTDVKRIRFLDAEESITGNFDDVDSVNGKSFDVTDEDGILTIVGNDGLSSISKIAGVGDGAEINDVGGAEIVETNEQGAFFFGGDSFIVVGDDNVQFVMNGNSVAGVNEFGVEGQSAALVGKLNGLTINGNVPGIEVEGDADDILVYAIGADGEKILAEVGGEDVTIKGTGGASFVVLSQDGKYTFDDSSTAPEYVKTYELAGGDSFVVVGRNGSEVAIADIEKGESITGDFSGSETTFIAEDGASAVIQVDGDNEVVVENDAILIRNLSDSAVIVKADNVEDAWTDAVLLGTKIGVTDADGHNFTVEGGIDEDGVNFKLDGAGHIIGVESLGEGVVLRGSLSALENVNGKEFDVVETPNEGIGGDGEFAIVGGASDGIGAIVGLSGIVTVINAGGASKLSSDGNIILMNSAGEQGFAAFGVEDFTQEDLVDIDITGASTPREMTEQIYAYLNESDGVDFVLDEEGKVTAIDGVGVNEIVSGTLDDIETINGQDFDVQGASAILVQGSSDSGIKAIVAAYGDDVQVKETAGAKALLAAGVDKITFGESAAFEMATEDDVITTVGFGLSGTDVKRVSFLGANESITGNFDNVDSVNGKSFDVVDEDGILTIVGNDGLSSISKIAGVGDGAEINDVGGAEIVETNEQGAFFFGGDSFIVVGDDNVQFVMNGNSVAGVNEFGVEGQSAALVGKLNGLTINDSEAIDVEGDEDEELVYAIGADGKTYLAQVGGDNVTIRSTGGASAIEVVQDGTYTYAPTAYPEYNETYKLAGGDSSVLFSLNEDEELTISDIADGEAITTDALGEEAITFVAENGASAVIQVDNDDEVTVVNEGGAFVIDNLSDSAVIAQADNVTDAWTEELNGKLTVTDASGSSFTAEGTDDGVNYILDGAGKIVGVDDLDEDVTLRGALGALSSVNGVAFDVVETPNEILGGDGEFAIVGGSNGIGAITELGGNVQINDAGGASLASLNDAAVITFKDGSEFIVLASESSSASKPEVDFALEDSNAVGIAGVNDKEIVYGSFDGISSVNKQEFQVTGASIVGVRGQENEVALSDILVAGGEDVTVTKVAGASFVTVYEVEKVTFGESATFQIEGDLENEIVFGVDEDLAVKSINDVEGNESITGDFNGVESINGKEFDVTDADGILTIVGNEGLSAINMIAGVGDSAIIANVAGASIVRTNAVGSFSFAGNDAPFAIAGDSSVDFVMIEGESAAVAGVNNFGDEGAATLEGALKGLAINGSELDIDIEGDADDIFSYMVDESGENATLGGVGGESGAIVRVNATAGASFVQTNAAGTFVFAGGQSFTTDDDSVTFELNGDGQVVAVYDLDTGKQITGNFAEEVAVEGDSGLQGVQVDGDEDVTVYHGSLILKDISDLATIKVADDITEAWTDPIGEGDTLKVTDTDGHEFVVEGGDSDGVAFLLDGQAHINGVDSLGEGVVLSGDLGGLSSVNGKEFEVTEIPTEGIGGDGEFAIVGASDGIGAIVGLSGVVSVVNAGGASKLFSDGNIALNVAGKSVAVVIGVNEVTPEQILGVEISADSKPMDIISQFAENIEQSDGAEFTLDEEGNVTGISGIGGNEVLGLPRPENAITVNGQELDIQGASGVIMQGTNDEDGISAIVAVQGADVKVNATAGASTVLAVGIDQITFGEDDTFAIEAESGVRAVAFRLDDDLSVKGIGLVESHESVTGDFSNVEYVNQSEFDVTDKDELTIVGNDGMSTINMIAGVGDGAVLNNVAGASIVQTNEDGEFTFAGNDAPFAVAGDSSVDFVMIEGESAAVAGVNNFGDEGAATLEGALKGLAINGSELDIDIENDADDIFSYMVDESGGNATLGGVGGESGAIVRVNATAGASFVQTNAAGTFVFAGGQSFTTDDDSVTFELNGDGQVVAVYDLDTGKQITGNFAEEIAIEGDSGLQGVQVDGDEDVTVYHGSLILKDISDLATIKVADDITEAWTDPIGEGDTLKVTDTDGHEFVVEGGDSDGVAFLLDGQAHINGVDSLGEGVMLTGSLSVLDEVNGKEFDVTEIPNENLGGDGEFAIVGGNSGIGAIAGLSGVVSVVNAGGADKLTSDGNIILLNNAAGQSFIVLGANEVTPNDLVSIDLAGASSPEAMLNQLSPFVSQSDGVDFLLDESGAVTAVGGLSGNEVLGGNNFSDVKQINGQDFDVTGAQALVVQGGASGANAIVAAFGEDVQVNKTAGAEHVLAAGVAKITFGESAAFEMAAASGVTAIGFGLEGTDVKRVTFLDANESVTGNFNSVEAINTADFDVTDKDEITVVGEGLSAISKIAGVGNGAVLNNVAGASIVETNEEGKFTFAGNSFVVVGDDNVQFVMDPDEDAKVVGVNEFGVEGQSAVLVGKLNGIAINEQIPAIEVEGDEDEVLVYAISADGDKILAEVGGDDVTVRGTAGASYVELVQDGKYTFANSGIAAQYAKTYELAGGDSSVLFNISGNNALTISDIDKGESITGDFSGSETTFLAVDGTSAVIQIDGDTEVMVENDAILIRNLSDSAVIVKADNVYEAWTDELSGDAIAVTDAGGKSYIVEGTDADGVKFVLDGAGNIVGVDDLDAGATLSGDLAGLSSVNGATFDVNDPDNFIAVVGASSGISEIQKVSDGTTVNNAGGADKVVTDTEGNFTLFGDSFAVENDNEVAFLLDGDKVTGIDKLSGGVTADGAVLGGLSVNGKNFDIVNDADDLQVFGTADETDIAAITKVGAADDGTVTINEVGGASYIVTDKTGSFTFTQNGKTFTTDDDNIIFGREGTIDELDEGKKVTGDFSDEIKVNGEAVQVSDADSLAAVYGGANGVAAIGDVDADATVGAWGSASAISVKGSGNFTFIGADDAEQSFTADDEDGELVFVPNDDSVIGGVKDFENGTLSFDPNETAELAINGQSMTFASDEIATLTIADQEVVIVEGITDSVSGITADTAVVIGVSGVVAININGKDINADDADDQFNVLVHSGEADYVYAVDGPATVNVENASVRANATGSAHASKDAFVIGGENYTMDDSKDVNDGFTFVTDENGVLTGVYSLEGGLVVEDGDWKGTVNGGAIEIADGGDKHPVTIGTNGDGIDSVNGLQDGDSVSGDLDDAVIHIPGSEETGGGASSTTVNINGKPYTIAGDEDGVDVQGDSITGLDDEASLTGPTGKQIVNGKELDFGDNSGEKTAKGRYDEKDAYFEEEGSKLIRLSTAINSGEDDGFNIEDISGIPGNRKAVPVLLEKEDTDAILATAGTSMALLDLDQPLTLYLDNEDVKETQEFDVSGFKYTKSIHLYDGPQAVTLNNDGGNLVHVETTATGKKDITLGDGGDVVVVDGEAALQNAVAILGGAGDDSIYVRNNVNTVIDLSKGGDDMILTFGKANARITLAGYEAGDGGEGAAIRVEEYLDATNSKAGSIAEGILNGTISFGDGVVNINAPDGHSEIFIGTDTLGGQIVNLMTHATSGNDVKQAVAFTGKDGGVVDASDWDSPLIMVGNMDGSKSAGSSMAGGAGSDTFLGGAGDNFFTGEGNDLVILEDDATRGGARVEVNEGRTTVLGANGTLAQSTGDTIAIDASKLKGMEYNDVTGMLEIDGDGYYAAIANVDVYTGNYTELFVEDTNTDELYRVAIGTENSTIHVSEQEDLRPNVFFGENTAIDFRDYTGDAIIDLKGDLSESYIDDDLVLIDDDITVLYAGAGTMAFKGDDDNETFYAGKGTTYLYGDGGKNLLVGYQGLDKEGQTYFYVLGNADGAANTITGFNFVDDEHNYRDTKKVTADVLELDLEDNELTRLDISGNDVVIEVTSKDDSRDTESAVIVGAVGKNILVGENVVAQIGDDKLTFDQFADFYYAAGKNATVEVSDKLQGEVVLWLDNDETGKSFEGDIKVIDATKSAENAQLAGNDNDNVIYAGSGETSLWGGDDGDDLLVGGEGGRNTFFYSLGNGDDTITGVQDGDLVALDINSLDDIDEISVDADAIRIKMNDGDELTIVDNGKHVGIMVDNGEGGVDTYYTDEARRQQ